MAWTNVQPEVNNIPQSTASTCWLACLKMLYVWKGKGADEPLAALNADPNIFPDEWLGTGVAPDNCLTIARCLGLGHAGDGDIDINYLGAALKQHGPYWAAGEFKKGYAHVKVIVGVNPELDQIKLINPWNPIDPVDYSSAAAFNARGARWKVDGSLMYWR